MMYLEHSSHIWKTGKSSEEDLLELDAVTEESASFINKNAEIWTP